MMNIDETMTMKDVIELIKETGSENTYNILLLGGPDMFAGTFEQYEKILKILETPEPENVPITISELAKIQNTDHVANLRFLYELDMNSFTDEMRKLLEDAELCIKYVMRDLTLINKQAKSQLEDILNNKQV